METKTLKKKVRASIDEGGDTGCSFGSSKQDSSSLFLFTAIIDFAVTEDSAGDVINTIRKDVFNSTDTKKVIHFRKATEQQKNFMQQLVRKQNIISISVITVKKYAHDNGIFKGNYSEFNKSKSSGTEIYFGTLETLLINLSKYADEHNFEMYLDIAECGGMISTPKLKNFIKKLEADNKISKCFLHPQILVASQKSTLQLADIVVSSIYSSLEPSQGFLSAHGISMYPIIYKSPDLDLLNYGIIFNHLCDEINVISIYPWLDKDTIKIIYNSMYPDRITPILLVRPS